MKNRLIVVFIIILGIIFYSLTLRGDFGNPSASDIRNMEDAAMPFESSHERAPYAQLLAITENKSYDLSRELADVGAPDVGFSKGKFYSYFPPGVSFLILPAYILGSNYNLGLVFAYATVPVFSIFSLILIYLISRRVFAMPTWASVFAALVYGFATTSWSYSITIYQHAFSTTLFLLCFYATHQFKNSSTFSFFWAAIVWISFGISVFIDYPNLIIFLPIIGYFILSAFNVESKDKSFIINFKLSIIITFILFAGIISVHGYYNYKLYGTATKLSNTLPRYERDKFDANDPNNQIAELDRAELKLDKTFQEQSLPSGLFTLLFDNDKGVFFFSPILLLSLLGFFYFFKKFNLEFLSLFFSFIANLFLYASFADPWGGWAFGPRYLILSMSILSIIGAYGLWKVKWKIIVKIFSFILVVYSSGVALLGAITTNIVPPKIEAIPYGLPYYNYLLNIDFLKKGIGGSFLFNSYLKDYISLSVYYFAMYVIIVFIFAVILFILPIFEKRDD